MKRIFVALVAAAFVLSAIAVELPSTFKVCDRSLPEKEYYDCISKSARDAIVSLAGGMKAFKILPLEPLAVDSVKIGESQGSVTLRQEYKNIKLHGLTKNLEIKNYHIDWDKCLLSSDSLNPQVDFVADYKVDGRILLLPVRGAGKSNITMYNLRTHNDIHCEKYQKNGETYLRVKKFDVKFSPSRVTLRFENLFDGDTLLGEQMNNFINQNSDLLFKELQAPYEETFGLVFAKISNEIYSRIPFNKIFPPP
ncbi:take-out-like carrier protein [Megachile rotundata]|uniref:take-out-like carrier protein n=1 Tax=Megachile rotundata TaxID=143995 RepID=UPI000258E4AF|nr:PREDICTED: protein takeout-like [Megachile rotundata]